MTYAVLVSRTSWTPEKTSPSSSGLSDMQMSRPLPAMTAGERADETAGGPNRSIFPSLSTRIESADTRR